MSKEQLTEFAEIKAELFSSINEYEGEEITEFGLTVYLSCFGREVSRCEIPSISPSESFVKLLAGEIERQRISPARAADFIEQKLSE